MVKLTSFLEGHNHYEMMIKAIAIDSAVAKDFEPPIYPEVIKLTCWLLGVEPQMTKTLVG